MTQARSKAVPHNGFAERIISAEKWGSYETQVVITAEK